MARDCTNGGESSFGQGRGRGGYDRGGRGGYDRGEGGSSQVRFFLGSRSSCC